MQSATFIDRVYMCVCGYPPPPIVCIYVQVIAIDFIAMLYVHRGNGAIYLQMCICYSNCVKAHKVWAEVIYTLVQLYTLSVWEVPRGLEVKDILFAEGPGNNDAAAAQSHSRGSCSTQPSLSQEGYMIRDNTHDSASEKALSLEQ